MSDRIEDLVKVVRDEVDSSLEVFLITFFGSKAEAIRKAPYYVLEEVTSHESEPYGITVSWKIRRKTPEEMIIEGWTTAEHTDGSLKCSCNAPHPIGAR